MKDAIVSGITAPLRFLVVWMLWHFVLFNLGRITLLVCISGRYPCGAAVERDTNRIAWPV